MVLKNYFASVVFLVLTFAVSSQNPNRQFLGFTSSPEAIRIQTNDGHYEISAYNQLTIETSFIPNNEQKNAVSHAVVQAVKSDVLSASDAGNK